METTTTTRTSTTWKWKDQSSMPQHLTLNRDNFQGVPSWVLAGSFYTKDVHEMIAALREVLGVLVEET
jgi:hypothetical protein